MSITTELIKRLKEDGISVNEVDYNSRGYHLEPCMDGGKVRSFAKVMLEKEFFLDFVSAVHTETVFQVIYHFGKFDEPCRVNAKVLASEGGSIPTISDIFHGANWHERETHDFYGIQFTEHPDLRPLLLDEDDSDLNPLLKNGKKLKSIDDITRKAEGEPKKKPVTKKAESPE